MQQEFALFLSDTHRDPAAKSVDLPANFSPHAPFTVEAWSAALATHGNAPRIPVLASITPQLHALLSATAHIGTKTTVRTRARDQGVSPDQLHLRWAEEAIETLARLGFTEEHMSDLKPGMKLRGGGEDGCVERVFEEEKRDDVAEERLLSRKRSTSRGMGAWAVWQDEKLSSNCSKQTESMQRIQCLSVLQRLCILC